MNPRWLLPAALCCVLIGYWAGTASLLQSPTELGLGPVSGGEESPSSSSKEGVSSLDTAFEAFIQSQRDTLALYRSRDFHDSNIAEAEAYRDLLYTIIGSIKAGALQSHDYPRFMRAVDWTSKAGLDNPDNNYYVALIDDNGSYRIRGNRGTTTQLIFQLVIGQPGVGNAGSSTNVSIIQDHELQVADDGSFEIIVSAQDPGEGVNWLQNAAGAESILVRFTHNDWLAEQDAPLFIDRIDGDFTAAPALTEAAVVRGYNRASQSMYDRTASWLAIADGMWTKLPRNSISPPRATPGGLVGQYSAFGNWGFADDEAVLLEFALSDAPYQGIQLGTRWFVSLDYETHTSTLNGSQLQCPDPDHCVAVIAKKDPGIANWLDTDGLNEGLIFMRWQGLSALPDKATWPRMQHVKLGELDTLLPSDTARVTPAQRTEQRQHRRQAIQRRFGG